MSLTEKRARSGASQSESELIRLITNIVDQVLQKRRMRPMPAQAGMSKRQFAVSMGLSLSTIEEEIREGRLEARHVGKRTIVTPEAGERWRASLPRANPQGTHNDGATHANV